MANQTLSKIENRVRMATSIADAIESYGERYHQDPVETATSLDSKDWQMFARAGAAMRGRGVAPTYVPSEETRRLVRIFLGYRADDRANDGRARWAAPKQLRAS